LTRARPRGLPQRRARGEDHAPLLKRRLEPHEKPPAECPRQGADGKEQRRAGGYPAVAVDIERATGDEAVQADVDAELLIPRVEDRHETQLPAQMMAGIGADGEGRVGDRPEEDLIPGRGW
jgi:hypothetical protein